MVPDSSFYVPKKSMTSGRSSFGEPQRPRPLDLADDPRVAGHFRVAAIP